MQQIASLFESWFLTRELSHALSHYDFSAVATRLEPHPHLCTRQTLQCEHASVGPAGVHVSGLRIQKAVPRLREKVNCEEVHSPSGAGYIPNLIIVTYPRANTCLTKTTLLQETRSVLRNPNGGKALFAETAVAPRVQSQFPGTRCLSWHLEIFLTFALQMPSPRRL